MQYPNYKPLMVSVICKGEDGNIRILNGTISHFECFGSVRYRFAEMFGLELNEFDIYFEKNQFIDPEWDDDRYIKDYSYDIPSQVYLTHNKHYDKKAHPKYLLTTNQVYFDLLFSLLSKNNAQLTEYVWNLLQKLPVNSKLNNGIS